MISRSRPYDLTHDRRKMREHDFKIISQPYDLIHDPNHLQLLKDAWAWFQDYFTAIWAYSIPKTSRTAERCVREPHKAPQSSIESHRVSQSPTEPHRAPQSLTEPHRVAQSSTEPHRAPRSPIEPHRIPQSPTESYRAAQSRTESHRAPQSPTEPYALKPLNSLLSSLLEFHISRIWQPLLLSGTPDSSDWDLEPSS